MSDPSSGSGVVRRHTHSVPIRTKIQLHLADPFAHDFPQSLEAGLFFVKWTILASAFIFSSLCVGALLANRPLGRALRVCRVSFVLLFVGISFLGEWVGCCTARRRFLLLACQLLLPRHPYPRPVRLAGGAGGPRAYVASLLVHVSLLFCAFLYLGFISVFGLARILTGVRAGRRRRPLYEFFEQALPNRLVQARRGAGLILRVLSEGVRVELPVSVAPSRKLLARRPSALLR